MTLSLHRCKVCGTRWLLWPDAMSGGGWNLLDKWQRPGSCCDNAVMGDQIEHLRDIELAATLRADLEAAPAPLHRMPTCPICFAPELITFTEGEPGHEHHELMCRACETVFERASRPGVAVAPKEPPGE